MIAIRNVILDHLPLHNPVCDKIGSGRRDHLCCRTEDGILKE